MNEPKLVYVVIGQNEGGFIEHVEVLDEAPKWGSDQVARRHTQTIFSAYINGGYSAFEREIKGSMEWED